MPLQAIRSNPGIQEVLVSEFADDVLLTSTHPRESMAALAEVLEKYSDLARYKVNLNKLSALPIGLSAADTAHIGHTTSI
ncbi:Hypothetical predicted protein [Pelobates cultripes]|uniref:Reverse transcriptase domain-containing protein n=1 Tax=Pelobates cultripes TaxID=61616 RepID=A0AAD1SE72_PELCU|nr:Hypothetical predicted protein [Pelobates cultripes]